MDHAKLIASLDREERRALTQKSDLRGLGHLAGHLGLLAATGAWIMLGWPFWWVALLPHGVALVFLFTLEHEATHRTPFATRWMNDVVGHMAGLLLLLPFKWFHYFHMAH
ncbi:MAG: fatty acid desaturase, partial [Pseudomonadota bacterium]